MGRFVDDFTSGANRLLHKLWYTDDDIWAGHGMYPVGDQGLTLDSGPGDDSSYPTLDVRINTDINGWREVSFHTIPYDKRREPITKVSSLCIPSMFLAESQHG
jgi:hypothetical protein